MSSHLEMRVKRLEDELRQAQQLIRDLQVDVGKLKQDQFGNGTPFGGGGGGSGAFYCLPTSLAGATGSWPSLTPGSQSLTVYQVVSGALLSLGSATVYNFYPSAAAASKVAKVSPVGDGTYALEAQSCT